MRTYELMLLDNRALDNIFGSREETDNRTGLRKLSDHLEGLAWTCRRLAEVETIEAAEIWFMDDGRSLWFQNVPSDWMIDHLSEKNIVKEVTSEAAEILTNAEKNEDEPDDDDDDDDFDDEDEEDEDEDEDEDDEYEDDEDDEDDEDAEDDALVSNLKRVDIAISCRAIVFDQTASVPATLQIARSGLRSTPIEVMITSPDWQTKFRVPSISLLLEEWAALDLRDNLKREIEQNKHG